ncbi:pentapeptide repeat-containing protein [Nocardiopsis flavescens]
MRSLTPRQWTGIALAAVALPALTATTWPLLAFLRGLLPDDLPLGRILLGGVLAVVLVIAAVLIRAQRRTSVRLWWLILAAWAAAIAAVAGMVVLIWLVLGTPGLDLPADLSPRALDAIATRAFAVVAGLGGVALLVIHYRRQRTTEADAVRAEAANVRAELAAEREVAKLFTDTFDSASSKLGDEHAAVRLAGVHALARLADEAPPGREDLVQMVIDVLCAYLRMPYTSAPDELAKNASKAKKEEHRERELVFASFREVRHTIIRIIGNRLREETRWQGKDYDFTGVVFDGGDLDGAHFSGGDVSFREANFFGGIMSFEMAEFSGGTVSFYGAHFSGGTVAFDGSHFSGGTVLFSKAMFSGGEVAFIAAEFSGGMVSFDENEFDGGILTFEGSEFSGAALFFVKTIFSGGTVTFEGAKFSGGTLFFVKTIFSGGKVAFERAQFSGCKVAFEGSDFTGGELTFRQASGACPRGLMEAIEAGEPWVVLPELWQPPADGNGEQET